MTPSNGDSARLPSLPVRGSEGLPSLSAPDRAPRRSPRTQYPVPLVRCRLSGPVEEPTDTLRYVPLAEFGLWQHLMQTRHARRVNVESVSLWISEDPSRWDCRFEPEDLDPVHRLRLEVPGPFGKPVPIERYLPADAYPQARDAILAHFGGRERTPSVVATPGYFLLSCERSLTEEMPSDCGLQTSEAVGFALVD